MCRGDHFQKGLLGTAGAAVFFQNQFRSCAVAVSAIWQVLDVVGEGMEIAEAAGEEFGAEGYVLGYGEIGEHGLEFHLA